MPALLPASTPFDAEPGLYGVTASGSTLDAVGLGLRMRQLSAGRSTFGDGLRFARSSPTVEPE